MKDKSKFKYRLKKLLKDIFIIKENIYIKMKIIFTFRRKANLPKIYYGGSRQGDNGGPLVKIKKLNKYYPENKLNFNIIYLQSNSIYLNNSTIKFLKKNNYPIFLNQNGVFYEAWFEGNWQKENSKISKAYHLADYVFWQSKFSKKASEKFLGEREGLGCILYNAVNTKIFIPSKKSFKKKFIFLITCNIRTKSFYRISTVIEAFNELLKDNKKIHLKIAGNIEDDKDLLKKIKLLKLDENITFIKSYSQRDAPHIYADADAYITMAFQDNCPSAVIEAMSCGLPILYSNSGGIPELVGSNSGIGLNVKENWKKIEVPSKSDIKNGMRKIIEYKNEMSENARARAIKYFDIKDWINKHNQLFEEYLQKYNY